MANGATVPTNFVLFGPAHLAILFSVVFFAALLAFVQRRYLGPGKRRELEPGATGEPGR